MDQTGGGIGEEGRAFFSWLAILLLLKNGIEKSKVTSWIRFNGNFALHRSLLLYLRGSQQVLKTIDENCYTSSTFGYF